MSRSGATAPPPGLSRLTVSSEHAAAAPSAEGRSECDSQPRSQHRHRRTSRNQKPKAEKANGAEAEVQAEASSSSRKPRTRNSPKKSPPPPQASDSLSREKQQGENKSGTPPPPSSKKKHQDKGKSTTTNITATPASTSKIQTPSSSTRRDRSSSQGQGAQRQRQRGKHRQQTRTPTKPLFKPHLDLNALVSGLEKGILFRAKLRCNPGDRSQGFCTVPGLPHDVFIPDWKPQNRAIEGDEVVFQILPLSEWRNQKAPRTGGERENRRKGRRGGGGRGRSVTPSTSCTTGNIIPFGSSSSTSATAARRTEMSTSGVTASATTTTFTVVGAGRYAEEEEVASRVLPLTPITPPTIEIVLTDEEGEDEGEAEVVSELVAAPALVASPSGGELPISLEHSPLGLGGVDEMEDEEEDHDLSMVGFLTAKLQETNLQEDAALTTPAPAGGRINLKDRPWADATSPSEAISTIASLLHNEMQGWRATAEVVGIINRSERRNVLVGVLKMYGDQLQLIPRDPRLPRCMVEHGALKHIFSKETVEMLLKEARQEEVSFRTLLAANITSWDVCHRRPFVALDRIVGQAGGLEVEIEALLTQERVKDDDQFTPEVLACLPAVPWSISGADVAERKDFRSLRIFSVDPPTARDLDDALSIEELPNGMFRIGVHIADVSHFVTPATPLDEEAAERSTSVYLVDRVIPMLPRLLCEELCSLNPGVDRLAFSIVWEMDSKGNLQSTWAGRSIICSCGKLSYPQVQELIDGTATAEGPQPVGVQLHGTVHSWADVARDALRLHSVASEMRRRRFEVDGALRLDNARLYFEVDDEGNAVEYGIYQQKEANRLVEEFMLAANMTAAKIISSAFPDRALLRRHMPPNATKLQELATTVEKLLPNAPKLDVSSAGTLQKSLSALRDAVGPEVAEVVTLMCTKPMQTAQYFCTGDQEDPSLWRHYALAVGHYTHFTSPIRRYPDVLVHRLLQAALDKEKESQKKEEEENTQNGRKNRKENSLLATDTVAEIALHANERKTAAKAAQDGALKLYLASLLLNRPSVFKAVVIGLGGSRFFDAYVPALGIDVRVHTDRIVHGGEAALDLIWNDETKILKIDVAEKEKSTSKAVAVYDDIENFDKLHNPENIEKMKWPMELRALCSVAVVVGGARSKSSGSPAGVHAKIFV